MLLLLAKSGSLRRETLADYEAPKSKATEVKNREGRVRFNSLVVNHHIVTQPMTTLEKRNAYYSKQDIRYFQQQESRQLSCRGKKGGKSGDGSSLLERRRCNVLAGRKVVLQAQTRGRTPTDIASLYAKKSLRCREEALIRGRQTALESVVASNVSSTPAKNPPCTQASAPTKTTAKVTFRSVSRAQLSRFRRRQRDCSHS